MLLMLVVQAAASDLVFPSYAPTMAPEDVPTGEKYIWIGVGFAMTLVLAIFMDLVSRI